jgi:hypothetical protein
MMRATKASMVATAAAAIVLITGALAASASAAPGKPTTPGPDFASLSAAQWTWELEAVNDPSHPVVDPNPGTPSSPAPVNCALGQSGPVWFLAGTTYAQGFTTTYRSCSVPPGRTLFFPLIDAWADNLPCPPNPPTTFTATDLTNFAGSFVDGVDPASLHASIDGRAISNVRRAQASGFTYTLPANNAIGVAFCGAPYPAGTMTPTPGAYADGYYAELQPMPPGTHELDFGGTQTSNGTSFVEGIHYTITVTPH